AQVDGLALLIDDRRLAEGYRERLIPGDLAEDDVHLVALADRLQELRRFHSVLLGGLEYVLLKLVLGRHDLLRLDDGIEDQLQRELLLRGFTHLGTMLIVLETSFPLEMTMH